MQKVQSFLPLSTEMWIFFLDQPISRGYEGWLTILWNFQRGGGSTTLKWKI